MVDQDLVVKFWQIWRWGRCSCQSGYIALLIFESSTLKALLWGYLDISIGTTLFWVATLETAEKKLMEVWSSVGEC